MTKIQNTLEYLKKHGSITGKEAMDKLHYYRLSDGIMTLRKRHKIKTVYDSYTDEEGRKVRYGVYVYEGEK